MTKQTYDITAWCDRRFFALMSVEADSPEAALKIGMEQVHDAPAEDCDLGWEWDEFRVEDEKGDAVLEHIEERARVALAAPALLEALRNALPYAEAELASLRSCLGRDGDEILDELARCESAIEQAREVIEQAEGGRISETRECLPPDPEGMNDKRAAWAGRAIAAFRNATGCDEEDALGDLLANMRHWADRHNFDFNLALDRARYHYEAETSGEAV